MADVLIVPESYATIQSAISAASEGDTVLVQRGTYFESLDVPETSILLAGEFLLSGDSSVVDETTLFPAGHPPAGRCIVANGGTIDVTFRLMGLTIQGQGGGVRRSGGLQGSNRTIEIEHCKFTMCYDTSGGALSIQNGVLRVDHCQVSGNGSYESGAIARLFSTRAVFSNVTVQASFHGVGVGADQVWVSGDSVTFDRCYFSDLGTNLNQGSHFIYSHNAATNIRFTKCTFSGNRFHKFFAPERVFSISPVYILFDSNVVRNNEFFNAMFSSTDFDEGTRAEFFGNTFSRNTGLTDPGYNCRQFFDLSGNNCEVEVARNLFEQNTSNEYAVALLLDLDSTEVQFHNNYILGNNTHDALGNPPGGAVVMIDVRDGVFVNNVMANNSPYAVFQGLLGFPSSSARRCSWGHESGPQDPDENPLGLGDAAGENIRVSPWYFDSAAATPHAYPEIVGGFVLMQNYPNPFNPETTIEFSINEPGLVKLAVYDLNGREAAELVNGAMSDGMHSVKLDASSLASGIYFYRLEHKGLSLSKKMVLLK